MLKAAALVAGVPPLNMDKTIRIRVKRPFYYRGALQSIGEEFDCPYGLALEAIHIGKAERAPPPEPVPVVVWDPDSTVYPDASPRRGRPPKAKEQEP